jgi:hypothetical protein
MATRRVSRSVGSIFRWGLVPLLALGIAAPARAHEHRTIGPKGEYSIVVGWFIEPAFNDVVNAVDLHLTRTADKKPLDTNKGDIVDLEVEVKLLASEDTKAAVIDSVKLGTKPTITFNTDNRYAAWFKPTRAGAYAFHVTGKISDASDPKAGPVTIDETFVCGKGSRVGHAFVCLVDPQVFPTSKPAVPATHP